MGWGKTRKSCPSISSEAVITAKIILSIVASIVVWWWDKDSRKKKQIEKDLDTLYEWWSEVEEIDMSNVTMLKYPKELVDRGWLSFEYINREPYAISMLGVIRLGDRTIADPFEIPQEYPINAILKRL